MLRTSRVFSLSLLGVVLASIPAPAQTGAGSLDPAFGASGKVSTHFGMEDVGFAVKIQSNGKIVVAGYVGQPSAGTVDFAVARYNVNGTLDTAFGGTGMVTTNFSNNDFGMDLAIQPDGKIVVVGAVGGYPHDIGVVRYNADGTLDSTFGTSGKVTTNFTAGGFNNDDAAVAVAIRSGNILVAGYTQGGGGAMDFVVARYTGTGILDTSFGPGGTGTVRTNVGDDPSSSQSLAEGMAIQSDGKIVVVGQWRDFGHTALVRYTDNGTLDPTFGSGGIVTHAFGFYEDHARAVAIHDGTIVVVGEWSPYPTNPGFFVARLNSNGTRDSTFGSNGVTGTTVGQIAWAVAIQPNGKILVAASKWNAATGWNFILARFNANGAPDSNFGSSGSVTTDFTAASDDQDEPLDVALQIDGKIVVAGFSGRNAAPNGFDFAVVRYLTDPDTTTASQVVQPTDAASGTTPATLTFDNVTASGSTSLTTSATGDPPPSGFRLGSPATYYELTTTATFSGSIQVCINYTGLTVGDESALALFHLEGGVWVNRTESLNTTTNVICAVVPSLSPFAIFERLNRPPAANAGPDQTLECSSTAGATVLLDGSASMDPDGDPLSFTWTGPFGTTSGARPTVALSLGNHVVTLTVNDSRGGTARDTLNVVVRDTTPPSLSFTLSPNLLWPPDHRMVPISANVQVSDACHASPAVALLAITSNEPDNGLGDGDQPDDVQGATYGSDDRAFLLRAERSGTGAGRVYTVTYRATDASGNARTATGRVQVPFSQ